MASAKELIQEILAKADIRVNGTREWDIIVHNEKFFSRVLAGGSLALGESYMDGWWSCKDLKEFFFKILRARLDKEIRISPSLVFHAVKGAVTNAQSKGRAKKHISHHYDIGNDLYKTMLDETMTYSCGYWKKAKTLKQAQEAKYELICRKIGLKKGMRVLDIGCGWGGFAVYAAKKYKVSVVGVTLSTNQASIAKKRTEKLPVDIRIQDYRDVNEQFDRIISIGMFEHVGPKNYKDFFKTCKRCLKEDGLLLLHTIGSKKSTNITDPWIDKYIFPGGIIPSVKQIAGASEEYFVMEDLHNFGPYYGTTIIEWNKKFQKAWPKLKNTYDERFKRMWEYYLLACVGSFYARKNQLWQIVFSPNGVIDGYKRPE